ncbi:hypothetical protein A7311_08430 [Paenibacillus polymyxa]|jgi:hypothetical protein|nr:MULTISPECIES: hypothetical protein [Paenibacillus]MBP1311021.1 hypothetical protein [Paenibacillus sp. 1182]KAF6577028.1 hypothetical protein G9G53_02810 [Paenibacillus sp. EKM206P]KAF6591574.1 hypothetical protein G9G52_00855 [Paenibacillus sp. EKM205P]MBO3283939.1 hypothetical protein [Paenibacillus polymyxa]MCH6186637.1 hypothetical protein [Paenibacillus polymyxa]
MDLIRSIFGYFHCGLGLAKILEAYSINKEEVHEITMIHMEPIQVGEHTFIGVEVKLPKTTLLTISNSRGYIMCGASKMRLFQGI